MAWQLQVGDPARLALSIAFTANPDGSDDAATLDDSTAWGSFRIWVDGENLCAHHELGEVVDACHWYLLPLLEWFADNWNALFHEERLPLANSRSSAADSLAATKKPPLRLKEVDEFDWMASWAEWWERHDIRAARLGGLFPDLYLRRYRDQLEISTGAEFLPGIPRDYSFVARHRVYHLDVGESSSLLFEVLSAAVAELRRQLPHSDRLSSLELRLQSLTNQHVHRLTRLAYLSGFRDRPEAFSALADAIEASFAEVDPSIRSAFLTSRRDGDLAIVGTAYGRLLYGALSPDMTAADVAVLSSALLDNYDPEALLGHVEGYGETLGKAARDIATLSPGAQGSMLGELACEELGATEHTWVDIENVLRGLEIEVRALALSDKSLRAVSVFGEAQPPVIFCNSSFWRGKIGSVRRFTLAHELCHLLLDRELGDELAVATGPWAPVDIEQRANAFAAAFLMPTWLLRDHMTTDVLDLRDLADLTKLGERLHVSLSSLVDRLYNLDEITPEERLDLQAAVTRARGVRSPSR